MTKKEHVAVIGAGLVGSLVGILFRKRGFEVSIYEKRGDLRTARLKNGRSINLALSDRGIRALQETGIYEQLKSELVPMKGRMMHNLKGEKTFQAYGTEHQFINSVSRLNLNRKLISIGEEAGVHYYFNHRCVDVNTDPTTVYFASEDSEIRIAPDLLIGADGAFSEVRKSILEKEKREFDKQFLDYGYKELSIPASTTGDFQLEPNYLHIWPRKQFMLIALPNPDKTFTCTLFLPYEGDDSFERLSDEEEIVAFFGKYFPDVLERMPSLIEEFNRNPTSSLVTIKSFPWHSNRTLVIGDASHAIVPFYGQGMNSGFEDCRILMEIAESHQYHWDRVFDEFESTRKTDTDAIAELALKNFKEMRSKVTDDKFLKRKKTEAELHAQYPEEWLPLYSMVTFSHLPYSEALRLGKLQDTAYQIAEKGGFDDNLEKIMEAFNALKTAAPTTLQ